VGEVLYDTITYKKQTEYSDKDRHNAMKQTTGDIYEDIYTYIEQIVDIYK